jgi:hypothetical protein
MNTNTPEKPVNPLVSALARWNNEGGAQPPAPAEESDGIIRHLGSAVIMLWNTLPREIQRGLFDAAAEMDEAHSDPEVFRQHMAVFLHHNKNREMTAVDKGGEA